MSVGLFDEATRRLPLNGWDYLQLARGRDWAGVFEPLRAALVTAGVKVEQETLQRRLYQVVREAALSA